jgi:hypothetical protein
VAEPRLWCVVVLVVVLRVVVVGSASVVVPTDPWSCIKREGIVSVQACFGTHQRTEVPTGNSTVVLVVLRRNENVPTGG